MTVQELIDTNYFTLCARGDTGKTVSKLFCCDLLSIAMGKAPEGSAWVTVMANRNTLAVASLTDAACIVLAEGVRLGEADLDCARKEGITVFETEQPVFDAALKVYGLGLS